MTWLTPVRMTPVQNMECVKICWVMKLGVSVLSLENSLETSKMKYDTGNLLWTTFISRIRQHLLLNLDILDAILALNYEEFASHMKSIPVRTLYD